MEIESALGTLRTSLGAARKVNSYFGSFLDALRKIATLDLDAFCVVIAAGTGKKVVEVEEQVYQHGLPDLVEPCSKFVTALANGGQNVTGGDGSAKPGER
jgi:hypothetical protein